MKQGRRGEAPFIFALIQKNLPAEEQDAQETQPLNDYLVYLIMALVGIAALVFGFCRGAPRFLF